MRDCCEVIKKIKEIIPKNKVELHTALDWNYEDAMFKAPEETLQWEKTAQTLNKYIPKPIDDWEYEIVSIFTLIPIEKLKEDFKKSK